MSVSVTSKAFVNNYISSLKLPRNLQSGIKISYVPNIRTGSLLGSARRSIQAICHPLLTKEWLSFLETMIATYDLPMASAAQIGKPFGEYVLSALKTRERIAMLRTHHELAAKTLPAWLFASLWRGSEIEVGRFSGKSGNAYSLVLGPSDNCFKEGEYSFRLTDDADNLVLAQITFLLANGGGRPNKKAILIGGLQGPSIHSTADAKKRIVSATRALSGLRPKMAVFSAAVAFASACKAESVHAVSNETHVINTDAFYQRRRLRANYNYFWAERGGTPDTFGYHFPLKALLISEQKTHNRQRLEIAGFVKGLF